MGGVPGNGRLTLALCGREVGGRVSDLPSRGRVVSLWPRRQPCESRSTWNHPADDELVETGLLKESRGEFSTCRGLVAFRFRVQVQGLGLVFRV